MTWLYLIKYISCNQIDWPVYLTCNYYREVKIGGYVLKRKNVWFKKANTAQNGVVFVRGVAQSVRSLAARWKSISCPRHIGRHATAVVELYVTIIFPRVSFETRSPAFLYYIWNLATNINHNKSYSLQSEEIPRAMYCVFHNINYNMFRYPKFRLHSI